ncbi:MAG: HD domain-containing protein, partial [Coriobacteriia bacterium]|nr:HD domain-containing protein [Coriobacteriia bacterium]
KYERAVVAQHTFVLLLSCAAVAIAFMSGARESLGSFDYATAGVFAAAFFVMRLLALRLPQGDEVPITVMVGLCALGVLHVSEAVAAAAAVGLLDAAARFAQAPNIGAIRRATEALRAAAVLGIMAVAQPVLTRAVALSAPGDAVLIPAVLVGLAYAALDIVTVSVQERLAGGASVVQGVQMLLRPLGSVYLVHIAMAAVVLRVYPALGLWAFGIAVLMTLILQNSFNLYLRIRRAYGETIEALAHAAELDRPQDAGHAQRVAGLAIAIGRQMDLTSQELEHLRYAALLHDIGHIGHPEDEDEAIHALRGAAIVEKIPFLEAISPLIAHHHHDGQEVGTPLGAAIVGVCSRYDRLRMQGGASAALDTLRTEEVGRRRLVVDVLDLVVVVDAGDVG